MREGGEVSDERPFGGGSAVRIGRCIGHSFGRVSLEARISRVQRRGGRRSAPWMSPSMDDDIPSVIPEMRSSEHTTNSLSTSSPPPAASACSVASIRPMHRTKTGCANCWKPTPSACATQMKRGGA